MGDLIHKVISYDPNGSIDSSISERLQIFKGAASRFEFMEPINVYTGSPNSVLNLRIIPYSSNGLDDLKWNVSLLSQCHEVLSSREISFRDFCSENNPLEDHEMQGISYDEDLFLNGWQMAGKNAHYSFMVKVIDHYHLGKMISKDFLHER